MTGFETPLPVAPEPNADVEAYALGQSLRSLITLGSVTSPRSLQPDLGSSEAGSNCDRQIAYRAWNVPAVNFRDPLPSLMGIGFHLAMAELFKRLDRGAGRYLVEQPVSYKGVRGTVDLFDRVSGVVIDWKTTRKARMGLLRSNGPKASYVVQTQLYGAGLAALGETVSFVALAFVPVDGSLDDMWVWRQLYDQRVADAAIDRVNALRDKPPSTVGATASRLCPWCDHYRRGSVDLDTACPGEEKAS